MRRSAAATTSLAWFVVIGGAFGCLVPLVQSFADFVSAGGTPVPVASPPRLVVTGFYRYVRNPIYVGFLIILIGQTLLTGSPGMLEYTAIAWCIGAAAVRFHEEPVLACEFGAEYQAYRRAVHAWVPWLHPWTPGERNSSTGR